MLNSPYGPPAPAVGNGIPPPASPPSKPMKKKCFESRTKYRHRQLEMKLKEHEQQIWNTERQIELLKASNRIVADQCQETLAIVKQLRAGAVPPVLTGVANETLIPVSTQPAVPGGAFQMPMTPVLQSPAPTSCPFQNPQFGFIQTLPTPLVSGAVSKPHVHHYHHVCRRHR